MTTSASSLTRNATRRASILQPLMLMHLSVSSDRKEREVKLPGFSSTYVMQRREYQLTWDIGKVDKDGRYRSSYKPVGAETGRLSSGKTIFGTGGNQQNWPHDLLRFFLFDEGYLGYSIDLSQI